MIGYRPTIFLFSVKLTPIKDRAAKNINYILPKIDQIADIMMKIKRTNELFVICKNFNS
jgi:hypothetical protein